MSTRKTRARRRGHERRTVASPLLIGGAFLFVVAGLVLLGSVLMSAAEPGALETRNIKGLATAPVEVEEWSDFQ